MNEEKFEPNNEPDQFIVNEVEIVANEVEIEPDVVNKPIPNVIDNKWMAEFERRNALKAREERRKVQNAKKKQKKWWQKLGKNTEKNWALKVGGFFSKVHKHIKKDVKKAFKRVKKGGKKAIKKF